MRISFTSKGDLKRTTQFLTKMSNDDIFKALNYYGALGASALASATPEDTGLAASSWGYEVVRDQSGTSIRWTNSNMENGLNVIILIHYGHGTGTGGYVAGRNFISPTIQPIFDKIADDVWKGVVNA